VSESEKVSVGAMARRAMMVAMAWGVAACGGSDTEGSGGGGSGASSDEASVTSTTSVTATAALSFFVTSHGNGTGDFGGIAGADAFCQRLAESVASGRTWRAYVSDADEDARDRIGTGPWTNAADVVVANDVEQLHAEGIAARAIIDELGDPVPNVSPGNEHDILTGSTLDGRASGSDCAGWTSAAFEEVATVGHADATNPVAPEDSWNAAHETTGCDAEQLVGTGGTGRLYCFAID
jgi:hypothetical protein